MSRQVAVILMSFLMVWAALLPARGELFGVGGGLSAYFLALQNPNLSGAKLPPWLPAPTFQGRIHITLPLIFVDTLRLDGGGVGLNLNLNQYLQNNQQVNWKLTTSVFSLTFVKQFNLPFIGIYLGLGGDSINGQSTLKFAPDKNISLSWKVTTLHGVGGLQLIWGLFRFYLEGKALQPIIQNMDKGLSLFPWQVSTGLMLSFG